VCGKAALDAVRLTTRWPPLDDPVTVSPSVLACLPDTLRAAQRSISVDVNDQVVTLAGYVADDSQTEQLARLIRSVPGVQQIDRKLITDEELSGVVTEAIRRDPAAAAAQIQVSAHDGTVDITGEAPDRATVRAIERVAGQVPGVQVLHNVVAVRKPAGLAS